MTALHTWRALGVYFHELARDVIGDRRCTPMLWEVLHKVNAILTLASDIIVLGSQRSREKKNQRK